MSKFKHRDQERKSSWFEGFLDGLITFITLDWLFGGD